MFYCPRRYVFCPRSMTFFQPAFKINSKVERTSLGLKSTQILIICWFLPAGAANYCFYCEFDANLFHGCWPLFVLVDALGVLNYVCACPTLRCSKTWYISWQAINLYMLCYSFVGFVCVQVCDYCSSLQLDIIVSRLTYSCLLQIITTFYT